MPMGQLEYAHSRLWPLDLPHQLLQKMVKPGFGVGFQIGIIVFRRIDVQEPGPHEEQNAFLDDCHFLGAFGFAPVKAVQPRFDRIGEFLRCFIDKDAAQYVVGGAARIETAPSCFDLKGVGDLKIKMQGDLFAVAHQRFFRGLRLGGGGGGENGPGSGISGDCGSGSSACAARLIATGSRIRSNVVLGCEIGGADQA